jgi:hypothetical protein
VLTCIAAVVAGRHQRPTVAHINPMDEARVFWAAACNASMSRSLPELKQSNYAANAVAVSVSVA